LRRSALHTGILDCHDANIVPARARAVSIDGDELSAACDGLATSFVSAADDPPTRRHPAVPLAGERAWRRAEVDELAWRDLVRDQLRSLRTGLIVLGVLAVAACGLGLWALLKAESVDQNRVAVQAARIHDLERRVDAIQGTVARAPTAGDVTALRAEQRTLAQNVSQAERSSAQAAAQVVALRARVQRLEQRVDVLARATPTPTPAATP
jgi:polyhydroxyalkanoate synthesis regulator phasin